jgi:hypothetical protein
MTLAGIEMRGPGAKSAPQAFELDGILLHFVAQVSDRSFAPTVPQPPHMPDVPLAAQCSWIRGSQPQDLDNLPPLSAWPSLNEPFSWRGRSPQVCAVCASIRCSQVPSCTDFRQAQRTMTIAPVISSRRISRCPILGSPRTCLPPVEYRTRIGPSRHCL